MKSLTWQILLFFIAFRYFLFAGLTWLIWYKVLGKKMAGKKIQLQWPEAADLRREIFYSVGTILIFAGVGTLILLTPLRGHTLQYQGMSQYGWVYFALAFPVMLILHDAYFYWMHRLMHRPGWFKLFHLAHHRSTNPSPWAAFAFHPLEAVVEAGIFVILVFVMPLHIVHIVAFMSFMMLYNVYGHLGWELYPKNFSRHWLGKWVNTSVSHNQHHQHIKGNYSLYFLWWDRAFSTIRTDYDERFDALKSRGE
ncbi:MAG: sterol desaturase family protein [Spirochaetia bacterium]|nr:sterol desaturase family protein [Spirochaetia bacterium]